MSTTAPSPAPTLRDLRRWHVGSTAGQLPAAALPPAALPLQLLPFRDPARVRHDYPLCLTTAAGGVVATPLPDLLAALAERATAAPRIVQDNLKRLERRVRLALAAGAEPAPGAVLRAAGEQMVAELQLAAGVAAGLASDLAAMAAAAPTGALLALRPETALRLFAEAARAQVQQAREALAARCKAAAAVLRELLAVEAQKDPAAREAPAVQKSLGDAVSRFVDPAALARALGQHRGSLRTDAARLQRLQVALTALAGTAASAAPLVVLTGAAVPAELPGVHRLAGAAVATAIVHFDAAAATLLDTVRALRLTELEQQDAYDPERHDALLQGLQWHDLAAAELRTLPAIAAVLPARELALTELPAITQLLASGRPVQALVLEDPARDPLPGVDASAARLELAYLGIAFREAFVQQSTAARPQHLLRGFAQALASGRPGLHVIDTGLDANGHEGPLGAFLHAAAAIDGRAHPLFQYDPTRGETWARRFDFAGNPTPDADWPLADGAAFTFADYALLQPHLRHAFMPVPAGIVDQDLVPLADYLELPADEARRRLPFVSYGTADDGAPARAIVMRALVAATADRRRFWRTLQELAGVRNDYVREAVLRARQEAAAEAEREQRALAERHAADLAAVRAEATDTAMQGLARMLLDLDPLAMGSGTAATAPRQPTTPAAATTNVAAPAPTAAPTAPPTPAPAAAAAAADDDDGEPWIDSARCSTCNDCVNLNSLLFVYNENKQARIGDVTKGSYAQLVAAAEKCPSRCIHPGKPKNPDEPGLEALIARAAPFQS